MREVVLSAMACVWIGSAAGAGVAVLGDKGPGGLWWAAWFVLGALLVVRFVRVKKENPSEP